MNRTAIIYHPDFELHDTGAGHPERPERARMVAEAMKGSAFAECLQWMRPEPAAVKWIERVHSPEYRQFVEESCLSGRRSVDFGETTVCEESYRVACLAAGAALRAVDAVCRDGYSRAFSCARPPGHHARYEQAMGFCVFNNVAIAAQYAAECYGVERICILDWDVHHGNGTQETFYRSPNVLFCSLHQLPLYPHTGEGYESGVEAGEGLTLNLPMPPGSGMAEYLTAFEKTVGPAIADYRPQLFFISAGFDAHRDDPLADIRLSSEDYGTLTRIVAGWAEQYAQGRIVSVLEGGYHMSSLQESALAHVSALIGK